MVSDNCKSSKEASFQTSEWASRFKSRQSAHDRLYSRYTITMTRNFNRERPRDVSKVSVHLRRGLPRSRRPAQFFSKV